MQTSKSPSESQQKKSIVQPKLEIGQPDDQYEKEADAVADQIMQMPEPAAPIQKKPESSGAKGALPMAPISPTISPLIQKEAANKNSPMLQMKGNESNEAGSSSWGVTIENFGDDLLFWGGKFLEFHGGAEGTELEFGIEVRVPVYGILNVMGTMMIQMVHSSEGYELKVRPELGISVGKGSNSGEAYGDFLAGYTFDVQGKTPRRAFTMLNLALESEVRSMKKDPPPFLLSVLMGSSLALLDLGDRLFNFITEGEFESSFWPLLADGIWGSEHMEQAMEGMKAGEFAKSKDEIKAKGSASSKGADDLEASAGISIGTSQNRRIEKSKNGEITEGENWTFNFSYNMKIGPIGVGIDLQAPYAGEDKWGKLKFSLSGTFDSSKLGYLQNHLISSIEELIRIIIDNIQGKYSFTSDASIKEMEEQLEKAKQRLFGDIKQGTLDNGIWAQLNALGASKRGFEVTAEMDLTTKKWTFGLYAMDEAKTDLGIGEIKFVRKRLIGQF